MALFYMDNNKVQGCQHRDSMPAMLRVGGGMGSTAAWIKTKLHHYWGLRHTLRDDNILFFNKICQKNYE